jgi:two-component system sensor histidine kinase QseC
MLANFLSNAVEYTPDQGEISIDALSNDETSITLRIANTAPDLESSDLEHVFERFWRKETARTSSLRAGLGLSISQAVSQMLGIPLRAEVLNSKTFVITVTLPSSSAVSV